MFSVMDSVQLINTVQKSMETSGAEMASKIYETLHHDFENIWLT